MAVLSETEISNKKLAAGLLGIFLGSFGIHKFVLGYNNAAIIMLVVSLAGGVVTCGVATGLMSIIGLIEGIFISPKQQMSSAKVIWNSRSLGSDDEVFQESIGFLSCLAANGCIQFCGLV